MTWKVKIADPEFSCIAENLLETWQKANQTFKKIEYTMQVQINKVHHSGADPMK